MTTHATAIRAYQDALTFAPTRQEAIRDAQKLLTRASQAERGNMPELALRRRQAAVAILRQANIIKGAK